jgi:peptidoglycan L-alanyl-D-glutamate endopeptidase CwlK
MLGKTSNTNLDQCHPKLQRLIREVDRRLSKNKIMELTVTCGHRGEAAQNEAYAAKRSTKAWPDSLHNMLPSPAVDVAPYPIDWNDTARFARLAGYIQAVADDLDIEIRWGGDWDQDGRTSDERFVDMPHFELTTRERNRP